MTLLKNTSKKPLFWILQVFLFIACAALAIHFYPKAFPIVDFEIKMDRVQALKTSKALAQKYHWGPENFRQTASFDLDQQTQTFVELSAGGSNAFSQLLKDELYSPYTWKIRHFAEGKTNETWVRFTPQGKFYGFTERLSESQPGAALSINEALKIAESSSQKDWGILLTDYELVEKSQETQISKRIDHTFVYERKNEKIGEGRYRLRLVVNGDHLGEIRYFIKIPNAFSRKYGEMRSANDTISTIASISMAILYLLGGCGIGIFFLARHHWLIWKTPLKFGAIVAGLQLLDQINQFPLMWMGYDTAISSIGFFAQRATRALIQFLLEFLLLSVSFMAAEGLTRKAFENHPQFWRIWLPKNASSKEILGRTLGGYLCVGIFFLYVVGMYLVGSRYLGWWSPSDTLFQPNSLATYFPWLTSISNSFHAGFWEESLFRAVPLAGAALLGNRFGKRKAWITAGFIIQALIFAAAHANYPAQPSYARVIELILPSILFGAIYLQFGLLPGIILHYTFDVVSFAIPIFAASSPRIWIDRTLVVFFTLFTLWIVLWARWKEGRWNQLSESQRNSAWIPPRPHLIREEHPQYVGAAPLNKRIIVFLGGLVTVGLFVWLFFVRFPNDAPSLDLNRTEAIAISRQTLEKRGIHLSPEWEALAAPSTGMTEEDRFVWKTSGPSKYHELMGNYISAPSWLVRYVRFDTDVAERAEEYQIFISGKGKPYRIRHELPEGRKGARLDAPEARKIALDSLLKQYGLEEKKLDEVSSNASQLPQRKDWLFVFTDPSISLKQGEARVGVKVAGDQAVASRQFIFIPEEWERQQRNEQTLKQLSQTACTLILIGLFFGGVVFALIQWTKKNFDTRSFKIALLILLTTGFLDFLNELPTTLAQFSTVEPRMNQWISLIGSRVLSLGFISTCAALVMGWIHRRVRGAPALPQPWNLLLGFTTATGITLISATAARLFPPPLPSWGKFSALELAIPLGTGLQSFDRFVMSTLFFLILQTVLDFVTHHWSHRKSLGMGLAFLMGFIAAGADAESFTHWAIFGTSGGLLLALSFRYLIQSNFSLAPIISGSVFCLLEWRQIKMQPYTGSTLNEGLALLLFAGTAFFWHRWLTLRSKVVQKL
jgi:cbb3-type cytochrome oxidase subunit 3